MDSWTDNHDNVQFFIKHGSQDLCQINDKAIFNHLSISYLYHLVSDESDPEAMARLQEELDTILDPITNISPQ